jgi:TRAP-type uncharacterized transport system substrate-binding protein
MSVRGIAQRTIIILIAVIIILGVLVGSYIYFSQQPTTYKIKIFTGGTAGVYYPLGNALA